MNLTEIYFSPNLEMQEKHLISIINEFGCNLKVLDLSDHCSNTMLAEVSKTCHQLESFSGSNENCDFTILFQCKDGKPTHLCRTVRHFQTENSLTFEFIDSLLFKWALNLETFLFWGDMKTFFDVINNRSTQLKLKRIPELKENHYKTWKNMLHLLPCIEQIHLAPSVAKTVETFHIFDSLNKNITSLTLSSHCPLDWLFLVGKLFTNLKSLSLIISACQNSENENALLTQYYQNTDVDHSEIFNKLKEFKFHVQDDDYNTHMPSYFQGVTTHINRIVTNSADSLECFEMNNYSMANVNDIIGNFIGLNDKLKLKHVSFNNCHKLDTDKISELVSLRNPIEVLKVENCFSANTHRLFQIKKYIDDNNLNVDFIYS